MILLRTISLCLGRFDSGGEVIWLDEMTGDHFGDPMHDTICLNIASRVNHANDYVS